MTHQFFDTSFASFGPDIYKFTTNRIALAKKFANRVSHRAFNQRCFQHNVIHKTLAIWTPDKSASLTASCKLLGQRIHDRTINIH